MRIRRSTALAATAALVLSLLGATGVGGVANAATGVPTYEPDPGAVGTVSFFNSGGTQITSGAVGDAPMAAYYKASGPKTGAFAFNKGYAAFFTPVDGVTPAGWQTGDQSTPGQDFATLQAGYPAGLTNPATNAVIAGGATDFTLATHIAGFPSLSTLNPGVFQIRVYTSASADTYYAADVKVTGSTWSQVYPAVATGASTTTALAISPPSPVTAGDNVTLTATVSPTAAVGAVQFYDGLVPLGTPVVLAAGVATTSTTALTSTTHSLTATFVPTDSGVWAGSTSAVTSFTVAPVALIATTTTLVSSRTGSVLPGTAVRLTASVLPANIAGSVQFFDRNVAVGASVTVVNGSAVLASTGALAIAIHSFKARFTPTPTTHASSTSVAVTLKVAKVGSVIRTAVTKVRVKAKPRLALVVAVGATGVVPTGRVYIYKLVKRTYVKLGYGVLRAGKVTLVLPVLPKGYRYFKLVFGGTSQILGSVKVVRVRY